MRPRGLHRVFRVPTAFTLAVSLAFSSAALTGLERSTNQAGAAAADGPLFTFVSIPDFLNVDIADVRARAGRGWDRGDPNSINPAWRRAIDVILDQVQSERPDLVLVAGDLVGGRWGRDHDRTGTFGPVATRAQRLRAVTVAGDLYYAAWARRFRERGLTVYPAIGDHEIGDNPWPPGSFKQAAVPTYKRTWARHFTLGQDGEHRFRMRPREGAAKDTAYAVRLANSLLVSVDVFRRSSAGVQVTVKGGQLRWLDRVLAQARHRGVRHIIVQGHVPVLGPVRSRHSSRLMLDGGADSRFWRTLQRHRVDLYLCGEVHAMTTLTDDVVQVAHGGLAYWGDANYLVGRVFRDRIELRLKELDGGLTDLNRMWQAGRWQHPFSGVAFGRGSKTVGTLVIDDSGGQKVLRDRTGLLLDG